MNTDRSAAAGPALTALRQASAAQHTALEALLQLDGPLPLARYGAVLQGFESFLAAWEPRLARRLPPAWRDFAALGSRHALVCRDLALLGLPHASPATAAARLALADAGGQPAIAAALGSLYVLEGSALGGQVIARRLGLAEDRGGAYFLGHGAQTGERWRAFRQRLGAQLDGDSAGTARACAAAVATFNALGRVFQQMPGVTTPGPARDGTGRMSDTSDTASVPAPVSR